jgi:MFS family permease
MPAEQARPAPAALLAPARRPAFRRIWIGTSAASLAEQLFIITLTLLVLDVAGPGAAIGTVLAIAAVPRAILLPLGGVLSDRVSPALVATVNAGVRTLLLAVLAVLVLSDAAPLWLVAVTAGLLGVLDAAYYPAAMSLLPRVVPRGELPAANSLVQGAESVGDLAMPAAASAGVALFGIGEVLAAIAVMYGVAAVTMLGSLRDTAGAAAAAGAIPRLPAIRALVEGVRFAWSDPVIRVTLMVLVVLNVGVAGPVLVGGAVLAEERFGGAGNLGVLMSGFGAGALAGLLVAGATSTPKRRGLVLIATVCGLGVGLGALGQCSSIAVATVAAAAMGVCAGYLGVVLVAWLQERVPLGLQARIMSLVAFAALALDPLSYALAGWLIPAGAELLFGACGALVLLTGLAAAASRMVRALT